MKTSSKAIIWIIIVFLTGVLFGGALAFLVFQPHKPPWLERRSRENRSPDKFVQMMSEGLELDQEQREQLSTLLIETRDQFNEVRQQIRKETRERLQSILHPDQLKRFDEVMAKAPRFHPLGPGRKPDN